MMLAGHAVTRWDSKKKQWVISVHAGEAVINRPPGRRLARDAADEELCAAAIETARDDGYEVRAESVRIER